MANEPPSISDIQETTSEAEYQCGTCGHHWDVHRGDHPPTFCTARNCQSWTRPIGPPSDSKSDARNLESPLPNPSPANEPPLDCTECAAMREALVTAVRSREGKPSENGAGGARWMTV